ncbi:MAG: hypothetical protein QOH05_931 [Acetobacteraceae bacterium]|jgi:hypothetical protein|nr:hypothetical protein [Acetobacteraceae bacterium]
MRAVIEDTWFPTGTRIRIAGGVDGLLFRRCLFEGGEILIEPDVNQTIFAQCIFRGTTFSGQSLSERIATGCKGVPAQTEDTAASTGPRGGRFRG